MSSKISGETATLSNRALDRIFDFAAEVGMPVLFHCDVNMPFPKPGQDPYLVVQLSELVLRHPKTTIIWAHAGVGRIVHPVVDHLAMLERALNQTQEKNLLFDLSWDETAKYVTDPAHVDAVAAVINRHPDRFLFGTDEVAPDQTGGLSQGLSSVPAAVGAPDAGGARRVSPAQLRARLRSSAAQRARLGGRPRTSGRIVRSEPTPISGDREVW